MLPLQRVNDLVPECTDLESGVEIANRVEFFDATHQIVARQNLESLAPAARHSAKICFAGQVLHEQRIEHGPRGASDTKRKITGQTEAETMGQTPVRVADLAEPNIVDGIERIAEMLADDFATVLYMTNAYGNGWSKSAGFVFAATNGRLELESIELQLADRVKAYVEGI